MDKKPQIPFVGQHATLSVGSDCYPYEVVWVSPNKKRILVRALEATPAEGHNYYGNQVYTYHSNPNNTDTKEYSIRKSGYYHREGERMASHNAIVLGVARYYQDPSF